MSAELREAIRRTHRRAEADCVADLVAQLSATRQRLRIDTEAVAAQARTLVEAVRRQRSHASGVDHLMHEFSLSSQEGVALMCLAEALLRVPDSATADRLIRDKIAHGDWAAHLGGSDSLFVNAAAWGLMLTGALVSAHGEGAWGERLTRILQRSGEPLVRRAVDFAMRLLGKQFVMGETIGVALVRSAAGQARGYLYSYDMLGEAALTDEDARRYAAAYARAIHAIGRASGGRGIHAGPGISIKLSALHPRYTRSQRGRVMAELLPRLAQLMELARGYDIGVNIDAEEADRLELSLDLLQVLAFDPALSGWNGLGFVVQAYQKRCPQVVDFLADLARRSGRRLMLRLVKGAYWDSEIKRAQTDGVADYPVYTRKAHTDLAYLACADRLLMASDAFYPQFATHNAYSVASVLEVARAQGVHDFEFQCLHGMGEPLYDSLVGGAGPGVRCRIYAPVGTHASLLPYLVRRLLENGANTSFVNRLVDPGVSLDALVVDPLQAALRSGGRPHPAIALPSELFGAARRNSAGCDLSDEPVLARMEAGLAALAERRWWAEPRVPGAVSGGALRSVRNPARRADRVGDVREADAQMVALALDTASACAGRWFATPAAQRAAWLRRAADLLEAHDLEFVSLAVREAGKTWPDAHAELREAVDFCRYYAQWAVRLNAPALAPGVAVCISPWNFPLAIFLGQIAAALAAGCVVIAKPAEQTPLIAHHALTLMHAAGIPPDVLQWLPGPGETVGAMLTADSRVQAVVFTGSTAVARQIYRTVSAREDLRLIAETGGLNAMIVDSTALPEQVVQDAITSGFLSAGQRCSALRVLCLQQEVAEPVLALLKSALLELQIGDPARRSTDIGPVIDEAAREALHDPVERMRVRGCPVFQVPLPETSVEGCFMAPTLIEVESFDDVDREVFGPVVHVLRYAATSLDALVDAINAAGYGLTMGVHSRIDETCARIAERARVGNLYVNRNMVGAVVGVQPFGGEGLSGTGPKAGGPLYVARLADLAQIGPMHLGLPVPSLDAAPEALRVLAEWARSQGDSVLFAECCDAAALSLFGQRLSLPGPTGERNTLRFVPRGAVLCRAAGGASLLRQLVAVFATGNHAVLDVAPEQIPPLPAALASAWRSGSVEDLARIDAVLYAGPGDPALMRQAAARPGPLLALIRPTADGRYPLYRLMLERVRTDNIAAAGGNTALMSLTD